MATSTDPGSARLLAHALDQAGDVLDHVHPDRLGDPTPCGEWDVGRLADHLVASLGSFLTLLRGGQPDWSAPPHVTEAWGATFRVRADDLLHAWHELEGEPPVPAGMVIAELAVHAWDLATAVGFPVERFDPEVAEVGLGFLRSSLKPELRGEAFQPERTAPDGAGPYEQLAAFAGREV